MKHIIIIAALFAATFASAQTKSVLKNINGGTITESLTIGSGKTLTIASGATINATGATITGFTASASFASLTGEPGDNTSLAAVLAVKAPLASPSFTGVTAAAGNVMLFDWDTGDIYGSGTFTGSSFSGNGSALTGITPSQLAQASATSGQVLTWSGTAWAPATATGGVTSITGTANQITVTGTTTPTLSLPATITGLTSVTSTTFVGALTGAASLNILKTGGTLTGTLINSTNGAVSAPVLSLTGTTYASGTATTTKPALLIEPTGTTSTGWSTAGTLIGANAATGFVGKLIDLQLSGSSKFRVTSAGSIEVPSGGVAGSSYATPALSVQGGGGGIILGDTNVNGWIGIQASNATMLAIAPEGLVQGSTAYIGWSSNTYPGYNTLSGDVKLFRDAAGVLAQRNSTNAQAYRLYETDSGSNDEYLEFSAAASVNTIKPAATGTGTASAVRYYTTTTVWFGSGSGTPEASQTAGIGSVYTDTATGTLYRKTSGTGNTGWVTP